MQACQNRLAFSKGRKKTFPFFSKRTFPFKHLLSRLCGVSRGRNVAWACFSCLRRPDEAQSLRKTIKTHIYVSVWEVCQGIVNMYHMSLSGGCDVCMLFRCIFRTLQGPNNLEEEKRSHLAGTHSSATAVRTCDPHYGSSPLSYDFGDFFFLPFKLTPSLTHTHTRWHSDGQRRCRTQWPF